MSISEAFEKYIHDFILFAGLSKKTEESYIATCKHLIARFGNVDISSLTFDDIRDWKLWLDNGRSTNTVRGYVICLRVVLKFVRHKTNVLDYRDIPIPKRSETEVRFLDDLEIEEIINYVGSPRRGYCKHNRIRNIALLEVLAATGLRNAELCSLNRGSIKKNTFTVIGKGNKMRIGFIHDSAIRAIDSYLAIRKDGQKALFLTNSGKRITPNDVRQLFNLIRRDTEFDFVHPHTFRHSYATSLLTHHVDIRHVQMLMGHTDLNTTARYTHVVNDDLKEVYLKALT